MSTPLVILAAGLGRRFGGNKQLAEIGLAGELLLEFNMYEAWMSGVGETWLIIKPGSQADWKELQDRWKYKMEVRLFEQPDFLLPGKYAQSRLKPWGTGHALLAIEEEINSEFLLINADDYYGSGAFRLLLEIPLGTLGLAAFALKDTLSESGAVNRGICLSRNEYLAGIEEYFNIQRLEKAIRGKSEFGDSQVLSPESPVSMNCWKLDRRVFFQVRSAIEVLVSEQDMDQAELFLPALVQSGIIEEEWPVKLIEASGPWHGLTFASDLEKVKMKLQNLQKEGPFPVPLWKKN